MLRSGLSVARNLEVRTGLTLLQHSGTVKAANDAQNVRVDRARGKDNDNKNLFKK